MNRFGLSTLVLGSSLSLLLVGCEAKDRDAALDKGQVALSQAQKASSQLWAKASEQARHLSADSGKDALEQTRKSLEEAKSKMGDLEHMTASGLKNLDSIKADISKIDAAEKVKELKTQATEKLEEAKKLQSDAERLGGEAKERAKEAQDAYDKTEKALKAAQDQYNRAQKIAEEAWKKTGL